MKQQPEKPTLSQTSAPKPEADKPLAEAELDKVSGGLASSVLKKRDDTNNAVIGKIG
jgi:hypothetical protein